jgi:hypothetical protein
VPNRGGEGFNWNITQTMFFESGVQLFLKERVDIEK